MPEATAVVKKRLPLGFGHNGKVVLHVSCALWNAFAYSLINVLNEIREWYSC
jgi:hypothetical protein